MPASAHPLGPPARDRERFEGLLQAVLPPAFGVALRLTGERPAAEELVREASVRAFRSFASLEPGTSFGPWFFRILVDVWRAGRRPREAGPEPVDWEDTPDLFLYAHSHGAGLPVAGSDPAAELLERLGTERVAAAIERLPEEYRLITLLYFMDDFGYREIAAMLDCPAGAVRSRLHRGRKMLQKALWQAAEEAGIAPARQPRTEGA